MDNSGYDSDTILSQALDIFKDYMAERENDNIFITQNAFSEVPDDEKNSILDILTNAVDVFDMLDDGGPSEIGAYRNVTVESANEEKKCQDGRTAETSEPERFCEVNQSTLQEMVLPNVPKNTQRKNQWAVNVYNKWKEDVLKKGSQDLPQLITLLESKGDLLEMGNSEINFVLSIFFLATKKQNGEEYPPDTIFSMATALQRYLELRGREVSFLQDSEFRGLKNCIDNILQQRTIAGIGKKKKQAQPITNEQEEYLWKNKILGDETPEMLFHTMFWLIGIYFGLRGGEEHRNLSRTNFEIDVDLDGRRFLKYTETVSKTNRGGLKHRQVKPHSAKAYEFPENSARCHVNVFQKYLSKLHPSSKHDYFYFKPFTVKSVHEPWFTQQVVGHNKLANWSRQ